MFKASAKDSADKPNVVFLVLPCIVMPKSLPIPLFDTDLLNSIIKQIASLMLIVKQSLSKSIFSVLLCVIDGKAWQFREIVKIAARDKRTATFELN
ncbi:MAG: hypothetical protein IPP57_26090 [Candidatus Obscuribacter sp.]|nr:hypothetical protein [Candidatus Obscuribacter sp.]